MACIIRQIVVLTQKITDGDEDQQHTDLTECKFQNLKHGSILLSQWGILALRGFFVHYRISAHGVKVTTANISFNQKVK